MSDITELRIEAKGCIELTSVSDDNRFYELHFDKAALPFLQAVWPELTLADTMKMPESTAVKLMWSAAGWGCIVTVNGDTRW